MPQKKKYIHPTVVLRMLRYDIINKIKKYFQNVPVWLNLRTKISFSAFIHSWSSRMY